MHIILSVTYLLGIAAAAPSGGYGAYDQISVIDGYSEPRYEFNYAVNDPNTGDNKSQQEIREGGVVKGSYSLAEPDGTIRVVEYTADDVRGFNAVVKRIGTASHPQIIRPVVKEIAQPVYQPIVKEVAQPVYQPYQASVYESDSLPITDGYSIAGDYNIGGYGGYHSDLGLGLELGYGGYDIGGIGHGYGGH